ncbi:fumarylacetoacetate hydrolase family protein [Halalkalibacter akibai]|uniref:Fumarylacetoacetate hydrolase family protein n=1 Tax=Halalkalibacter akibai (strain ATCC 43226 / DSM 21942 / CIP 109018 / JCM 9157 / 1139) TaxID=1236973 RepID=W4QW45_HALA3|nr:fumarylacetoacetate hydrolase family protein [Halalkalibacter akibai]GAE36355.1 fumarylacetoacetate hydrolase family protein [Halalkalibacter akibai JCM 9157]
MITVSMVREDKMVLGVRTENGIFDVEKAVAKIPEQTNIPRTVQSLLKSGEQGRFALENLVKELSGNQEFFLEETAITFGPCVPDPEKIICVGLNYKQHADECQMDYPETPILFSKFANALSGHQQDIKLPEKGTQFDYEAELVLVIGREAKNVSEEDALSYVYGYCNGNDLSVRDLQFKSTQWLLGKTTDGFCPTGPYLVSKDRIEDPDDLRVTLTLNGEVRQNSNTSDMIFNCSQIISYISQHMTLKPGDLILTGTPEGVLMGMKEEEREWLKAGDVVTVEIEGLGALTNRFK